MDGIYLRKIVSNRNNLKLLKKISILAGEIYDFRRFFSSDYKKRVKHYIKEKIIFYVLFKDKEILGYCMEDYFEDNFGLTNVSIRDKRKGYGSILLNKIKEFSDTIYLEVWDDEDLLEFYFKNNFTKVRSYDLKNERPDHVPEDIESVVLLKWSKT